MDYADKLLEDLCGESIRNIAAMMYAHLESDPQTKWAGFNVDGKMEIVIQSLRHNRRVNFKVAEEDSLSVLSIDEKERHISQENLTTDDIVSWIDWVQRKD